MRPLFIALLLWPSLALAAPTIDPQRISDHIRVLASDDFEGRAPDAPGGKKAVDYIAKAFKDAGLEPGAGNGSWLQPVPVNKFTVTSAIDASMRGANTFGHFAQGDSILLFAAQPGDHVAIKDAPLVFVGYGISAPDLGWDDLKGADLTGKIAILMIGEPEFAARSVDGRTIADYGRLAEKVDNLARHGAAGVLFLYDARDTGWAWATAQSTYALPQFRLADDPLKSLPCQGWLNSGAAVALFKLGGMDLKAARLAADAASFHPASLSVTFSAAFTYKAETVSPPNVIGLLRGAKHPEQVTIYSAHWDHLGRDAKTGAIYSGALDDASGVAALIEIARVLAMEPRPDRSIVFLATTMEEKGLVGAQYYASHPVYPLANTVADLNFDILLDGGPVRDVFDIGSGRNDLDNYLARAVRLEGMNARMIANPGQGAYFRADHYAFAKAGVPSLFVQAGQNNAITGEYFSRRYHQVADKWSPDMRFDGMAQDAELYRDIGEALANSDDWPAWKPGTPFAAIRQKQRPPAQ